MSLPALDAHHRDLVRLALRGAALVVALGAAAAFAPTLPLPDRGALALSLGLALAAMWTARGADRMARARIDAARRHGGLTVLLAAHRWAVRAVVVAAVLIAAMGTVSALFGIARHTALPFAGVALLALALAWPSRDKVDLLTHDADLDT